LPLLGVGVGRGGGGHLQAAQQQQTLGIEGAAGRRLGDSG